VVSENDRLGLLKVSEPRADSFDVLLGLIHQRLLQGKHFNGQGADVITQEQAQVVGGLVVARTAGAQLATEGAEAFRVGAMLPARKSSPMRSRASSMVWVSCSLSSPARCNSRACALEPARSYGVRRK
jgi:hypothetical protein